MEDILQQFNQSVEVSVVSFFVKIGLTATLTFAITQVYKYTHRSLSYVHTFLHTLVVVGTSTCAVVMIIGNSIPMAFGLLGALSIIRFRTAIKDSRDTGYLFFAIAVSMASAAGLYFIATLITLFISTLLIAMHKFQYGAKAVQQKVLKVSFSKDQNTQDIQPHLKRYFRDWELLESSWNADSASQECVYLVSGRREKDVEGKIVSDLKKMNGERSVQLYGYSQTPIL